MTSTNDPHKGWRSGKGAAMRNTLIGLAAAGCAVLGLAACSPAATDRPASSPLTAAPTGAPPPTPTHRRRLTSLPAPRFNSPRWANGYKPNLIGPAPLRGRRCRTLPPRWPLSDWQRTAEPLLQTRPTAHRRRFRRPTPRRTTATSLATAPLPQAARSTARQTALSRGRDPDSHAPIRTPARPDE